MDSPAPSPALTGVATAAAIVTSSVAVSRPSPFAPLAKWTLPLSLLVTVLGFWWHSSRRKPKPPEEESSQSQSAGDAEQDKAVVNASCNGSAVKANGVCKTPLTDNPDLNAFIEIVHKLNAQEAEADESTLVPVQSSTPVKARSKRSAPQPCTPSSVEKPVVAKSVKYAESGTSVLETLEFGVAKLDTEKKSPTQTSPRKLWSEIVEEDLLFSLEQCVSSSDAKGAAAGSPPYCDSTTTDLSHSPRDYNNTKSYSESAANAEVADIITAQKQQTSTSTQPASPHMSRPDRDSANHSPSVDDLEHHGTGLLSSPSLSDVHSEGSSDSGKGCSEEGSARTPAGGSSVSGDAHPTTPTPYDSHSSSNPAGWTEYHFILPQYMVGRLIGKEGVFIHRIRNQTHTKMYIKRHPSSHKLKICAIEGLQENIDQALSMIRQKFSLEKYPFLTLEKVDYIAPKIIACTLRSEPFQLQLVEGINNDVCISNLISPAHFFVQLPSHPSYILLEALNMQMKEVYSCSQAPLLPAPVENALVAAPAMGGWFRAQITSVDVEGCLCSVRFVDYGGFLTIPTQELRQIRADFLSVPFQAIECGLANVLPAGAITSEQSEADWSTEALSLVHGLTRNQIVQVQVYDYDVTNGMPLVYLYAQYNSEYVLLNHELVMQGYGKLNPRAALEVAANNTAESVNAASISTPEDATNSSQDNASSLTSSATESGAPVQVVST